MSTDTLVICGIIGAIVGAAIGYSKWSLNRDTGIRMPDRPFPSEWREILEEKIAFYTRLSEGKKQEFEKRVHIFLLNVKVTGVETSVTHEDRILVAAGAIIPIFGFDNWHYANLYEVEIYPNKFPIPKTDKMASGLVGWGAMEGKMMLSRKALHHGFYDQNDQKNVAIHEFIHILDKQDGEMDGVLKLVMNEVDIMPWLHVINMKIKEIDSGQSSIRDYGAANKAEFLAVVSEFFFESPEKMKIEHPALFRALESFYNPKAAPKQIKDRFKKRRRS
jgi:Mlc titration factor MtfA (ptsG expression regulator)